MANPVLIVDATILASFGAVALPAYATDQARRALVGQNGTLKLLENDPVVARTFLGTPVYDILTLKKSEDDQGYTCPFTVVLTYRKSKKIIRTDITNRDGDIKEYINKKCPVVTVRGIIAPGGRQMPVDDMQQLNDYDDHVGTLIVESQFLTTLNFTTAIMYDLQFMPEKGKTGTIPFSFELEFDDPEIYKALANDYVVAEVGVITP